MIETAPSRRTPQSRSSEQAMSAAAHRWGPQRVAIVRLDDLPPGIHRACLLMVQAAREVADAARHEASASRT